MPPETETPPELEIEVRTQAQPETKPEAQPEDPQNLEPGHLTEEEIAALPKTEAGPTEEEVSAEQDRLKAQTIADMADIYEQIGDPDAAPKPAPDGDEKPTAENPDVENQPNAGTPATPAATPAAAPSAKPQAEKKPVAFEVPQELREPDPVTHQEQPVQTQPTSKPPENPDDNYVAGLPDEAQEEIAIAELAERLMASKYPAGFQKRVIAWYKKLDDLIKRMGEANAGRSYGPDDIEYQTALDSLKKDKPSVSNADSRQIHKQITRSEVKEEVLGELEPVLTEVTRKQKAIELRPIIEKTVESFGNHISKSLAEQSELVKPILAQAELGDKAEEDVSLEMDIINERIEHHKNLVSTYISVTKGTVEIDPKKLTPEQKEVNDFIVAQGENFLRNGGKRTTLPDGRKFIPVQQMNHMKAQVRAGRLPESELGKYFTFNQDMIIGMLAQKARFEIEQSIKFEEERNKKYGLKREKRSKAPAAPVATPTPTTPPKVTPKPAIGAGRRPAAPPSKDVEAITSIADDLQLGD